MKTVVITGGCGGLGYFLTEHYLTQGWRVVVVDLKPEWDVTPPDSTLIEHALLVMMENIGPAMAYKPDLIIHCAEENDPSYNMMEHSLHTNLTFHWSVLSHAAKFNVRTVVPLWTELRYTMYGFHTNNWDSWISTIMLRDRLIGNFNKGNCVITPVYLPRLLSPLSSAGTWGSLVKRFYNAVVLGEIVQETTLQEAQVIEGEDEPNFSQHIGWISPELAVKTIVNASERRTRQSQFVEEYRMSAAELLGLLFDMYGYDRTIIPTKGGFEIGTIPPHKDSLEATKRVVEMCNEWNRQGT